MVSIYLKNYLSAYISKITCICRQTDHLILIHSFVISILLYVCKTWELNIFIIGYMGMRCLRRLSDMNYRDRITNIEYEKESLQRYHDIILTHDDCYICVDYCICNHMRILSSASINVIPAPTSYE